MLAALSKKELDALKRRYLKFMPTASKKLQASKQMTVLRFY